MKSKMQKSILLLISSIFVSVSSMTYSQVNTESFRLKADSSGLSLMSDIELTLMAGNTDFQYFGSNSRITYNWTTENYTFAILNGGFGRENGKTFFSQSLFHLRNVNTISGTLKLEMFIQYDNNKILLLQDRYIGGIGLRYNIVKRNEIASHTGVSIFTERETYDVPDGDPRVRRTDVFRFNCYFTFNLKPREDITFLSVTYFQPDIQDPDDLRILSNNALNIKLSEKLGLNIKADRRYDNRPLQGIKKYDIVTKIGLGIYF